MAHISRHELKQDEFRSTFEEFEEFVKTKYRQIITVAGIVLVVAGLAVGLKTYQDRRDALYEGLKGMGIEVALPKASFYLWAKVPKQFDSSSFVAHILEKAGVLTTPGNGFGAPGEGYVRFALTVPVERMKEAVERLRKAF